MADVAELGLKIRSEDADKATERLDKFTDASRRAEGAATGMGAKITDAFKVIVAANDNAVDSAKRLSTAYGVAAKAIGALAAVAGGFVGAVASLKQFIDNTIEAEDAQTQLAAGLKSTAGASGQSVDSLMAHATALQDVTKYGDEAIEGAQRLLLTFTNIRGDVFPKATTAVLDMAQAMGMDLRSAALMVGKALNQPAEGLSALRRSGVQFSDAQKDLIERLVATGQGAKAQAIMLKELETQFGGSARAARQTLGGALTGLGNAWGDAFELGKGATEPLRQAIEGLITAIKDPGFVAFVQTIGTALFGAFTIAVQAATLFVNSLGFIGAHLDTVAVAAGTVGAVTLVAFGPVILGAVSALVAAIGTGLVGAVNAVTIAMARNPFLFFAVAITTAIVAIYEFRDEIKKAIGIDVVQVAKDAANFMIRSFFVAVENIKFVFGNLPAIIGSAMIGAVNGVISAVNTMVQKITEGVNWAIEQANKLPGVNVGKIGQAPAIASVDNPYADRLSGALDQRNAAVGEIASTDYVGKMTTAVQGLGKAIDDVNKKPPPPSWNSGADGGAAKKSYDDVIAMGQRKLATLQAEQAAVGLSAEAAARLKYETELLNYAQKNNITLTAEQKAGLQTLAGQMAATEAATARAKEELEFAKSATKGFLSDLRSGLKNGESLWQSFGNAANNVLDKIINKVEGNLVDALFSAGSAGGGGGGIIGGLLKAIGFASGGYTGGGGASAVAGVVHGGEYVFSKKATDAIGVRNLDAAHRAARGYASGGYVAPAANRNSSERPVILQYAPTINAQGADQAAVARIEQQQRAMSKDFEKRVIGVQKRFQSRGTI